MPFLFKIHWVQPALLLGGLLVGIGAAVGHHYFYLSHDGKPIGSRRDQEWVLRIGTGLAFLVRASFSISLCTALVQNFWNQLGGAFGQTMRVADQTFEVTTSPLALFDFRFWVFSPTMALFAMVYWLLPLAMLVGPSALTVAMSESANSTPQIVYNYNSRNLLLGYIIGGSLTLAISLIGVLAIIISGRSYSSNLSTVIRASRSSSLNELVQVTDTDGAQPLPEYLSRSKIRFGPVYGTSVALDGEVFAIEVVERGTIRPTRAHGPRVGERDTNRLNASQEIEGDRVRSDLSTPRHQEYPRGSAQAKDRPIVLKDSRRR
ncbi:hypothetical protein H072_3101 [Dactylellina haptotyla CBS 200.50]|uniref:Uncharacterized protein n=1 Tax=Dactylellina haptotyla (strain CBS 200.50) TaxID=1284197 RepID=S8AP75_DACHA|nr:hypothetical protein H072_3101 [Dactylellina haptotyla CBS 200.50]